MPVPRDRAERALAEALNKDGLTHLRTVAVSVRLSSARRFYKDFRNLRLAIVAKNREIRKQRVHLIANTTQPITIKVNWPQDLFRPDASEMAKPSFKSHNFLGPSHKAAARFGSRSHSLLGAPRKWGKKKEKIQSCLTNSITLVGFVGADPEQRQAKGNGSKFAVLSVATQRSWKNADDQWSSKTEWHRVFVMWN